MQQITDHCLDQAPSISSGTSPTQNTPSTTPQAEQNAIATPLPVLGALNETSWTIDLQAGHIGFTAFMDSDSFHSNFEYRTA
jgi:hypothetical protein